MYQTACYKFETGTSFPTKSQLKSNRLQPEPHIHENLNQSGTHISFKDHGIYRKKTTGNQNFILVIFLDPNQRPCFRCQYSFFHGSSFDGGSNQFYSEPQEHQCDQQILHRIPHFRQTDR